MSEKHTEKAATPATDRRPKPLARRDDAAARMMLSRVLVDDGLSKIDVAAFNSSI